jgi:hypothetical protein
MHVAGVASYLLETILPQYLYEVRNCIRQVLLDARFRISLAHMSRYGMKDSHSNGSEGSKL